MQSYVSLDVHTAGHFRTQPIRISWLGIAFPALLANYLGQAALLIRDVSKYTWRPFDSHLLIVVAFCVQPLQSTVYDGTIRVAVAILGPCDDGHSDCLTG